MRGSFSAEFQQDAYMFEVAAGEKVSIEVSESPAAGPISLRVVIYNPNGNQEYYSSNNSAIVATFTASNPGIYIMFVSNPTLNSIGEYFVFRQ